MKVSEILLGRAGLGPEFGGDPWGISRVLREVLLYLDELEERGAVPRPRDPHADKTKVAANLEAARVPGAARVEANANDERAEAVAMWASLRGAKFTRAEAEELAARLALPAAPARFSRETVRRALRESFVSDGLDVPDICLSNAADFVSDRLEDFFERFCMPDDVVAEGRRLYAGRNAMYRLEFEAWLEKHGRALFGMPDEKAPEETP